MISTPVLVLRKTPYSETSVIAVTLSPEYGRLDFMIRGAKQISKKKFPQVDLFRELEVHFNYKSSGLNNMHSVEILNTFDGIANFPRNYMSACEISNFILRNSQAMNPSPEVYASFKTALSAMSKSKTDIPWTGLVKLVYLDEHGFLPESINFDSNTKRKDIIKNLLSSVIVDTPLPVYPQETWQKLAEWVDSLCKYHQL